MKMPRWSLHAVVLAGIALRGLLYAAPSIQTTLATRPELVTAVSSFGRVREAAFLFGSVGSPYAGDVFHQPPLVFAFFYPVFLLPTPLQYAATCAIFMAIDAAIALGLARLCRRTQQSEEARIPTYNGEEIWLSKIPVSPIFAPEYLPTAVAAIYLFNPYSIASSIAMATTSLTHVSILFALVFAAEGASAAATLALGLAIYFSVYPIILLVPVVLLVQSRLPSSTVTFIGTRVVLLLMFWISVYLFLSKTLSGDWEFLEETYVWIAKYSDLTPNVGIFWYFFIEVFDRFIPYFLLVLHIHPLIYVAPIYLRLSHRPQAYASALLGIASLFQAYPSFGDFGFVLSLISIHPKTIAMIKNRYVYGLGLAVATCMMPVMWFLWMFPASGNANFFYNQTLVFQIFNTQFVNAFVGATMKRDKVIQLFRKRQVAQPLARGDKESDTKPKSE